MTKSTRTILFIFLAILFFLLAPLIVLYSLGWRMDWKNKKITQPGIFYFKIWPKNSIIYLNGKLEKKTDFFFGSALLENLMPGKYEVEIKKDGFYPWKKILEIKKREVTEAKNIILAPEGTNFNNLSKNIENFYFSPDEKKIVFQEITNNQNGNNSEDWALKLFELEKNIKSHLIDKKDISKENVKLIDLKFSPDSKRIILETEVKESIRYYILPTEQGTEQSIKVSPLDFLEQDIEKVFFSPKNSQKLLVMTGSIDGETSFLKEADLIDKKISSPLLENIVTFSIFNNNIYYLDSAGFLFNDDLSFNKKEKLNLTPLPVKKETGYKITVYNSYIFLQKNEILYIFDENKKSFQKIFEPVKNFQISPETDKFVFFNDYEIWVFFLEKGNDQPQKEAGDRIFITRFSEKIGDIFWLTNHYLIFNLGNKIKIAEIDDRDKINIFDLSPSQSNGDVSSYEFVEPKIFWNETYKKIFLLSEKNFYVSEKLGP